MASPDTTFRNFNARQQVYPKEAQPKYKLMFIYVVFVLKESYLFKGPPSPLGGPGGRSPPENLTFHEF